jgi:hypothetical protein
MVDSASCKYEMESYVVLRRIDIDSGEILTKDQLPCSAVPTGNMRNGYPEYVYTTTNPELVKGYIETLNKYFGR